MTWTWNIQWCFFFLPSSQMLAYFFSLCCNGKYRIYVWHLHSQHACTHKFHDWTIALSKMCVCIEFKSLERLLRRHFSNRWNICLRSKGWRVQDPVNWKLTSSLLIHRASTVVEGCYFELTHQVYVVYPWSTSQRLMSRRKYQFSYDHWSQTSWAQPAFRWVKLSGEWGVLLKSNLGVKPTWLLRETGNSAPEADPRIPPNQKKKKKKKLKHENCL